MFGAAYESAGGLAGFAPLVPQDPQAGAPGKERRLRWRYVGLAGPTPSHPEGTRRQRGKRITPRNALIVGLAAVAGWDVDGIADYDYGCRMLEMHRLFVAQKHMFYKDGGDKASLVRWGLVWLL